MARTNPDPTRGKRTTLIGIALSYEEREVVRAFARSNKLNFSAWARPLIFGAIAASVPIVPFPEA